ncbi:UNVERIFIED_CONTAM: hypothetical protein K2H54_037020 [Gekko kuhli]
MLTDKKIKFKEARANLKNPRIGQGWMLHYKSEHNIGVDTLNISVWSCILELQLAWCSSFYWLALGLGTAS